LLNNIFRPLSTLSDKKNAVISGSKLLKTTALSL